MIERRLRLAATGKPCSDAEEISALLCMVAMNANVADFDGMGLWFLPFARGSELTQVADKRWLAIVNYSPRVSRLLLAACASQKERGTFPDSVSQSDALQRAAQALNGAEGDQWEVMRLDPSSPTGPQRPILVKWRWKELGDDAVRVWVGIPASPVIDERLLRMLAPGPRLK